MSPNSWLRWIKKNDPILFFLEHPYIPSNHGSTHDLPDFRCWSLRSLKSLGPPLQTDWTIDPGWPWIATEITWCKSWWSGGSQRWGIDVRDHGAMVIFLGNFFGDENWRILGSKRMVFWKLFLGFFQDTINALVWGLGHNLQDTRILNSMCFFQWVDDDWIRHEKTPDARCLKNQMVQKNFHVPPVPGN